MNETDLYGIPIKDKAKPEIEAWAKAENLEMVLGQDELWSRRYGVPDRKKKLKEVVLTKIRHGIACGLHRLADYVEPKEYIRRKRCASLSQT